MFKYKNKSAIKIRICYYTNMIIKCIFQLLNSYNHSPTRQPHRPNDLWAAKATKLLHQQRTNPHSPEAITTYNARKSPFLSNQKRTCSGLRKPW